MKNARFNIAIIGAGAAGVAAACGAAKEGSSVLLIDPNRRIGGLATNAEVGTICGLYRINTTGFELNVGKFASYFAERVNRSSNLKPLIDGSGLKYLPFDISEFEAACLDLIKENNVVYWPDSSLTDVVFEGNQIQGIMVKKNNDVVQIEVDAVVDTSGIGVVNNMIGAVIKKPEFDQAISQVFTIGGIEFINESQLFLIINRAIKRGIDDGKLTKSNFQIYVVPGSLRGGNASLKLNVSENELNIPVPLTELINQIVQYLKSHDEAFRTVKLITIAPSPGMRIGSRPLGEYVLSAEDVVNGVKSSIGIARGNWPQEIWRANERVKIVPLKESYYDIPGKCLISSTATNLFFGGRCISADDRAIASARVIGTCLQTGYAAGYIASYHSRGLSFKSAIEAIRKEQFKL